MDDIRYKLRRIKTHRIILQIKEDIYDYMKNHNTNKMLAEYLSEKYPNIKIEMDRTYNEQTLIWDFYVRIHKPVEMIHTIFTVTPTGVKYNY